MKSAAAPLAAALAALAHAETTPRKEVTLTAPSEAAAERQAAVTRKTVIDRKEIEALGGPTIGERGQRSVPLSLEGKC